MGGRARRSNSRRVARRNPVCTTLSETVPRNGIILSQQEVVVEARSTPCRHPAARSVLQAPEPGELKRQRSCPSTCLTYVLRATFWTKSPWHEVAAQERHRARWKETPHPAARRRPTGTHSVLSQQHCSPFARSAWQQAPRLSIEVYQKPRSPRTAASAPACLTQRRDEISTRPRNGGRRSCSQACAPVWVVLPRRPPAWRDRAAFRNANGRPHSAQVTHPVAAAFRSGSQIDASTTMRNGVPDADHTYGGRHNALPARTHVPAR